jgi:ribosome-binding factor A
MASKAPSQRQLRVGELIRHALAEVFSRAETGDPDLERLGVTVAEVQASPDLKLATAYVRPFMAQDNDVLLKALDRNRRMIRGLITPRLKMKFMPDLRFRIDTGLDYASHIDEILNSPQVRRDLAKDEES